MEENNVSKSCLLMVEEKGDNLYPMYFGVSCAFFALKFISNDQEEDERLSEISLRMLQGSAQLLGLLVWKIQRKCVDERENIDKEVNELKKRRHEDARANEKVVSIFAAQEQSWFIERKKQRQQIGALLNEIRVRERKHGEISKEINFLRQSKEKLLEEEYKIRKDLEEKLKMVENGVHELKEVAKKEAQNHAIEVRKHKTAFIELVSNQRQLEAEMGRAIRQFEATKHELDSVYEQKEEAISMVQKLSIEILKMRKDSEQKDQILSAMLRKSKLDTTEKQILLKEVKLSKAKVKEVEAKKERSSLRNMLSKHGISRTSNTYNESTRIERSRSQCSDLVEYVQPELRENDEICDVKRLENWVRFEAEKYANAIEQRHYQDLEAFAEQMRLKDEKIETFRWRLLSTELESKRFQNHIEGLNQDILDFKEENMNLESILVDQESELRFLKEKFMSFSQENRQELEKKGKIPLQNEKIEKNLSQENEIEKEKDIHMDSFEKVEKVGQCLDTKKITNVSCKLDLNALGVSFKIKRLKQQLLMIERFAGKQETGEEKDNSDDRRKDFLSLMALLNKQVGRYQSLQGKADELSARMENNIDASPSESSIPKTKKETKTLAYFLEETFQLQRYIVATGQKMMEIQSKIASGFVALTEELDDSTSSDIKRFSENVGTLFKEVQHGLEVRIARIIGDLECTLACDGIIHLKR